MRPEWLRRLLTMSLRSVERRLSRGVNQNADVYRHAYMATPGLTVHAQYPFSAHTYAISSEFTGSSSTLTRRWGDHMLVMNARHAAKQVQPSARANQAMVLVIDVCDALIPLGHYADRA
jgi:hypothetical protein